jgi:hypothetical protein
MEQGQQFFGYIGLDRQYFISILTLDLIPFLFTPQTYH